MLATAQNYTKRTLAILLIIACFLVLPLLCEAILTGHAGTIHSQTGCSFQICLHLCSHAQYSARVLQYLAFALILVMFMILGIVLARLTKLTFVSLKDFSTPISLKVQMNN